MLHLATVNEIHINSTRVLPAEEGSRTRWYREGGWFTPPREWAAATAEPREAAAAAAAREEAAAREAARASFHATDGIAIRNPRAATSDRLAYK